MTKIFGFLCSLVTYFFSSTSSLFKFFSSINNMAKDTKYKALEKDKIFSRG